MDSYDVIARFYDCEHQDFTEDIDFYLQLIHDGPVLEVGVGSGRVMVPLLRSGLEVWGIDTSRAMLDLAARRVDRRERAHLLNVSVLDLNLPQRFGTVIMPLNTLWHLQSQEEQLAALQVVRRHLVAAGSLVIDLSNPLTLADRGSQGEVRRRFNRRCAGERVVATSAAWDREDVQLLELELCYDLIGDTGAVQRFVAPMTLRYTFRSELELMLRVAGFEPRHFYGSYQLDVYSASSPGLIAVATAPQEEADATETR